MCDCKWMPIESAPRDGTQIIVEEGIVYWRENKTYSHLSDWYTITGEEWPGKCLRWKPKFWQPLPAPPQASEVKDA